VGNRALGRRTAEDLMKVDIFFKAKNGVPQMRTVEPMPGKDALYYGTSKEYDEPQWLLRAYDCNTHTLETFAMKDINAWMPIRKWELK
jgi:hypothetical protein